MNTENNKDYKYRAVKIINRSEPLFVDMTNESDVEEVQNQYKNSDPLISTWYSATPDISAPRNYYICFSIVTNNIEAARVSALELINYIEEIYGIPTEYIVIIYCGGSDNSTDIGDSISVEIIILIPPVVFAGLPTPLMPALNYYLARQMVHDGLTNIEIDSYVRDSYIPLPNSINKGTGRFVIHLTPKELLYLHGPYIAELSKQPRPDDSMIMRQEVPEAVEWFTEVHADFEKKLLRQDELQKLILKNGWQVPACIRRLTWSDFDKSTTFEACRSISAMYSFLGSHEEEIRYHVLRLARRNSITGFKEYQKLKNIVTYGIENPVLAECQNPLLSRFCPAGGCFIKELIEEYEKPLLFQQM